jgi:hypothetical protein
MGTACSGNEPRINVLSGNGKVSIRVFDLGNGSNYREYFGEVINDTFTMESGTYFPGTTRYVVSVPKAKSEAVTPAPTPTPTPTPAPAPVLDLGPIDSGIKLTGGESTVLIDGKKISVVITPNATNDGLIVKGDGWNLEISALDAYGKTRALNQSGALDGVVEGKIKVIGSGYLPSSEFRIYLFANLILLENSKANETGSFTWTFSLPIAISAGKHVIQVNGVTLSKLVRSVSLPLVLSSKPVPVVTTKPTVTPPKVAANKKRAVVISFSYAKYKIGSKQLAMIKRLDLAGKKIQVSLVGYAQKTGSRDDLRISLDRAIEAKKAILKIAPKAKITVLGGGTKPVSSCKAYSNRCVIAKVTKG